MLRGNPLLKIHCRRKRELEERAGHRWLDRASSWTASFTMPVHQSISPLGDRFPTGLR